jgi:hypothetical protein
VLFVAYEMVDDPTMWVAIPKLCEQFIRRLPDDKALVSYCENTLVPEVVEHQKEGADAGNVHDAPRMKAMLSAYAAW